MHYKETVTDINNPNRFSKKRSKKKKSYTGAVLFICLLAVTIAICARTLGADGRDPSEQALDDVRKIMVVPENEPVQIATVSDGDVLANEGIFPDVENGDTVILFTSSMKAVLYRGSENKIVDVVRVAQ